MNTITDKHGKRHILSVPITQYVTDEQKKLLENEKRVALRCSKISQDVLAIIEGPEFFPNRKEEICAKTFGTRSIKH